MKTPIIRYEEDRTGNSPDNLIIGEEHELSTRQQRVVVPSYGPFFVESLIIRDCVSGKTLGDNEYYIADYISSITMLTGKELAATVVITNSFVSNKISIQYQTIGGLFTASSEAILKQFEQLNLDKRPVLWENILGKPDKYPPSSHFHSVGDVFGFEYLVYALDRIASAILRGDDAAHEEILNYIDGKDTNILEQLKKVKNVLEDHLNRKDNPHNVTPDQIGAYDKKEIDELLGSLSKIIEQHINDKNNPHNVTAGQLGVYLISQVDEIIKTLENKLNNKITDHINDKNNPHNVTAEQVGAWSSSQSATAINTVNNSLIEHVKNKNNPHNVTPDQIGVYTKKETDNKINDVINDRVLDVKNNNKLQEAATPISTNSNNLIHWDKNGLFLESKDIPLATNTNPGTVKLTDSLDSTAPNTALSASGGKALNDNKVEKKTEVIAGKGLTGGGKLTNNITIDMGVPSSISGDTQNTISKESHTHWISKASVTGAGIVQLIDSVNSDSLTLAPTANALRQLQNYIDNKIQEERMRATNNIYTPNNMGFQGSNVESVVFSTRTIPGSLLVIRIMAYIRQSEAQYGGDKASIALSVSNPHEDRMNNNGNVNGSSFNIPGALLMQRELGRNWAGSIDETYTLRLPPSGNSIYTGDFVRINLGMHQLSPSKNKGYLSMSSISIEARCQ